MSEEKSEIFAKLSDLFMLDREKVTEEISLSFYNYFQHLFMDRFKFEGYYEGVRSIYELTQAKGKVVLDVGCGFGLVSIILASLGAQEVHGIDISEETISGCKKLILKLPYMDNLQVDVGDGMRIDYPREFFDVVIANDVVSHILNLDLFLSEIKRVLKRKGVFYIYESNNTFNIPRKIFLRRYWRMVEEGPVDPTIGLPKPFREMRREMIEERFPSIEDKTLESLARRTQGMWGEEIFNAVEEYLARGIIPKRRGFPYIDPRSGMIAELKFNPFRLKRLLGKFGFRAKVIPPYFYYTYPYLRYPLSKNSFSQIIKVVIKRILRFFYPLSLFASPQFEILAKKEDEK